MTFSSGDSGDIITPRTVRLREEERHNPPTRLSTTFRIWARARESNRGQRGEFIADERTARRRWRVTVARRKTRGRTCASARSYIFSRYRITRASERARAGPRT